MTALTKFAPLGLLVAGFLLGGCGNPLRTEDCERLLDHYTELLVREQLPELPAQEIVERQNRARELAKRDPTYEFDRCPSAVNRRQFECAMQASSVDAVERCLVL